MMSFFNYMSFFHAKSISFTPKPGFSENVFSFIHSKTVSGHHCETEALILKQFHAAARVRTVLLSEAYRL
jgi:hypothetical protein